MAVRACAVRPEIANRTRCTWNDLSDARRLLLLERIACMAGSGRHPTRQAETPISTERIAGFIDAKADGRAPAGFAPSERKRLEFVLDLMGSVSFDPPARGTRAVDLLKYVVATPPPSWPGPPSWDVEQLAKAARLFPGGETTTGADVFGYQVMVGNGRPHYLAPEKAEIVRFLLRGEVEPSFALRLRAWAFSRRESVADRLDRLEARLAALDRPGGSSA